MLHAKFQDPRPLGSHPAGAVMPVFVKRGKVIP